MTDSVPEGFQDIDDFVRSLPWKHRVMIWLYRCKWRWRLRG